MCAPAPSRARAPAGQSSPRSRCGACPRQGIEWRVGAAGGPRVLGVAELERVRDALASRLRAAEGELARRGRVEERNRALLEEMIAAPERHRGLIVTAADIGEPSCR